MFSFSLHSDICDRPIIIRGWFIAVLAVKINKQIDEGHKADEGTPSNNKGVKPNHSCLNLVIKSKTVRRKMFGFGSVIW